MYDLEKLSKKQLLVLLLSLALYFCFPGLFDTVSLAAKTTAAEAKNIDYLAEYESIQYGTSDGLLSAELNAITQTSDGYIWVGSYSGLYRYDGVRFEKTSLDDRISSVTALFADSLGRLWIGTNDNGLCCYRTDTGSVTFFTPEDGLASYSIRSLCEDSDGTIYVGTVTFLSTIDRENNVVTHSEWEDITSVRSLSTTDGDMVAGVTNGGTLFFIQNATLVESRQYDVDGIYYAAVCFLGTNTFVVGTSGNILVKITFDGTSFHSISSITTGKVSYFSDFLYDTATNGYFFCAENGLGYVSKLNKVTYLMQDTFENSVSDAIKDYQGNIWFVSNKQGLMEYSRNPFINIFAKAELTSSVVNSLMVLDNRIYVGMDSGLVVINKSTFEPYHYDYLSYF
nr:hypothetical protein [Acetatifactor sp.]